MRPPPLLEKACFYGVCRKVVFLTEGPLAALREGMIDSSRLDNSLAGAAGFSTGFVVWGGGGAPSVHFRHAAPPFFRNFCQTSFFYFFINNKGRPEF